MKKRNLLVFIIPSVILSISILFSVLFLSIKRENNEIARLTSQLEIKTEMTISLGDELTEWKSLYREVFDTKNEYDASLKQIADLLFLKNMPIGMPQTSFSKEEEELTKEDFSSFINDFEDSKVWVNNIKSYLESRNRFISEFPFIYPLEMGHTTMLSGFGIREDIVGGSDDLKTHAGIDLEAKIGDPVVATADSYVRYETMEHPLYGGFINLKNNNGITSTYYAHLSLIYVRAGQSVKRGDVIGLVGNTGKSSGPHLHYEIRIGDVPIDPEKFITTGY